MLKALCNFRKNKKGFTLIELLIVVAIIAILAAIAIPQFGSYRKRGYNAAANSDLRNIRTTQEAMMADFQDYGVSNTGTPPQDTAAATTTTLTLIGGVSGTSNQSISLSPKVYAAAKVSPTGAVHTSYIAVTGHKSGDQYYGADSDTTTLFRKGFDSSGMTDAEFAAALLAATPASTSATTDLAAGSNWVSVQ